MIHKHQPCDPKKMEEKRPEYTICEVFREIYHRTEDEGIRLLCRVGVSMGKAMDGRLRQYKADWDKDFWDEQLRA